MVERTRVRSGLVTPIASVRATRAVSLTSNSFVRRARERRFHVSWDHSGTRRRTRTGWRQRAPRVASPLDPPPPPPPPRRANWNACAGFFASALGVRTNVTTPRAATRRRRRSRADGLALERRRARPRRSPNDFSRNAGLTQNDLCEGVGVSALKLAGFTDRVRKRYLVGIRRTFLGPLLCTAFVQAGSFSRANPVLFHFQRESSEARCTPLAMTVAEGTAARPKAHASWSIYARQAHAGASSPTLFGNPSV